MRLFSRQFEQPLTDLFNELAEILVAGSEVLSRTLGQAPRDRARVAPRLREHATHGAQLAHRISNRLADSLITPFEADSLYDLASAISDTLDAMEHAAERVAAQPGGSPPETLLEAAQVIERMCAITVEATWKLRKVRELESYGMEMRRLVRHGDRLVLQATLDLYERGGAAVDLMRDRDLIDAMDRVISLLGRAGRLADVLRVKAP